MKTWIVSSLDEETIKGEETIQGRKLYEEIRYIFYNLSISRICNKITKISTLYIFHCNSTLYAI